MNKSFFAKQVEEYGGPVSQSKRCQEEKKSLYFTSEERGFFFFSFSLCVSVSLWALSGGPPSTNFGCTFG